LLQMSLYGADGSRLQARGPLRQVSLPGPNGSPVQLLITNEGVAPALITLSLRADPPAPVAAPPAAPEGAAAPQSPAVPGPPPEPPGVPAAPPEDPRRPEDPAAPAEPPVADQPAAP
jgi:serine/threonine-protein kinase